jgi:hypothetical protein
LLNAQFKKKSKQRLCLENLEQTKQNKGFVWEYDTNRELCLAKIPNGATD